MSRLKKHISKIVLSLEELGGSMPAMKLYQPIDYILQLGGKRLRPAMTCLAAELYGREDDATLNVALAVEVFHNFSLVHDDIMDEAPIRRGKPTVHHKWNVNQAILSGDAMLVKAYELLGNSGAANRLLPVFNRIALEVCEGQQLDMDFEERNDVSVDEYLEMIRLKTSVLLGGSLQLGAIIAGANEHEQKALYNFGENLGIAFQLHDDFLDAFGLPEKVGKQVGGDILANKKTFLLIRLMELADTFDRQTIDRLMLENANPQEKVSKIKDLMIKYEVEAELLEKSGAYHQQALRALADVGGNPEIKQELSHFAMEIMQREY